MRYYSKKDTWLLVLLYGDALFCVCLGIFLLLSPDVPARDGWLTLLVGVGIGVLTLMLVTTTYYEITPTTLRIHSIWLQRSIELGAIQRVFPTHNPLSAPALSLDRLRIDYSKKGRASFALISPEDKFSFMQDLVTYMPDLEVRDGRVVRRSY